MNIVESGWLTVDSEARPEYIAAAFLLTLGMTMRRKPAPHLIRHVCTGTSGFASYGRNDLHKRRNLQLEDLFVLRIVSLRRLTYHYRGTTVPHYSSPTTDAHNNLTLTAMSVGSSKPLFKDYPHLKANKRGVLYVELSDYLRSERVRDEIQRSHEVFVSQKHKIKQARGTRKP